jgi:hypothetical protein
MIELSCFSQPPYERRRKRAQQINRDIFAEVFKETVLFLACWKNGDVAKLERRRNRLNDCFPLILLKPTS